MGLIKKPVFVEPNFLKICFNNFWFWIKTKLKIINFYNSALVNVPILQNNYPKVLVKATKEKKGLGQSVSIQKMHRIKTLQKSRLFCTQLSHQSICLYIKNKAKNI